MTPASRQTSSKRECRGGGSAMSRARLASRLRSLCAPRRRARWVLALAAAVALSVLILSAASATADAPVPSAFARSVLARMALLGGGHYPLPRTFGQLETDIESFATDSTQ